MESVKHGAAADRGALQAGDVIVAWSTAADRGEIQSPFDLAWVEVEQSPRGPVTLEGHSAAGPRVWKLPSGDWGIKSRPPLPDQLAAIYNKGSALAKEGKLTDAAQASNKAAESVSAGDPPWLPSWLLWHAAETLAEGKQWKDAGTYYERAAGNGPQTEPLIMAQLFHSWGYSLLKQGDWTKAEKAYQSALEQCNKAAPRSLLAAKSLAYVGIAFLLQGDLNKSRDYLQRALGIQEDLAPDSSPLASSHLYLGYLELDEGNISSARQHAEKALSIDSKFGPLQQDLPELWNMLGRIEHARGDYAKAEEFFHRTLEAGERIGPDSMGTASMLINLGELEQERGDLENAERLAQQALAIVEKIDPANAVVAAALNNLGLVAMARSDFPAAKRYFDLALALKKKQNPKSMAVASTLNSLGRLSDSQGNVEQAKLYLEEALSIQRSLAPSGLATAGTLVDLAELARKTSDVAKAEEYFREARAILEVIAPEGAAYAKVLAGLASIEFSRGQTDDAAKLYERAITAMERQTARLGVSSEVLAGFRASHAEFYRDYAGLLISRREFDRAFEVIELWRARALLGILGTSHVDIRKGVDPALLDRERSLQVDINAKSERRVRLLSGKHTDSLIRDLDKEIGQLLSQYHEVEGRIQATSPGYAALTQPRPLTASQVQKQLLDKDTLLLEYVLGDQHSYVFVVGQDSLDVIELPGRAEIDGASRQLYRSLLAQDRGARLAAARLSRMILGPVALKLRTKRLLVVADGSLQFIPFATLPEPESNTLVPSTAPPLVVKHEIVALPSASVLGILREEEKGRTPAPMAVAIFADPVFDKQDPRISAPAKRESPASASAPKDALTANLSSALLTRSARDFRLGQGTQLHLSRLRFTRQEAEAIMAVVPRGKGMEALDFKATRAMAESTELERYRIVHFATHGLLNSQHPELSGLVFSLVDKNGKPQDGFLQLQDIYNMSLPADLVVLSACETGLGKEINGEGLIGLTRGFMYAGASRVVASLWNVSDIATARLMARFYRAMEKDGLPPAAALRAAQIAMWKQKRWHSPYYWAAFQIQGEYR